MSGCHLIHIYIICHLFAYAHNFLSSRLPSGCACNLLPPHLPGARRGRRAAGIDDSECLLGCGSAHPQTFARFLSQECETSPFCGEIYFHSDMHTDVTHVRTSEFECSPPVDEMQ
jgi:hypothetical protein